MSKLDDVVRNDANAELRKIEDYFKGDVVTIVSPIVYGLDAIVRDAVLSLNGDRRDRAVVILDTNGGIVQVVERMVCTLRRYYSEVDFVIPDKAMSAGTVFALSGDRIYMDYFSCLGPIDPQIQTQEGMIPATGYLEQYKRLIEKSTDSKLSAAEYALLQKLELGRLYQFEQAVELSIELLESWLTQYKFKNWDATEVNGRTVTPEMKSERAKEIAGVLNSQARWHSHGRGINMDTLTDEIGIKIDDMEKCGETYHTVHGYFGLVRDYMNRHKYETFVHTREFF